MSQPIRGQGGHFVFPIGPKNTHVVEGIEILLPVKFRWIPFSGFRGEVENASANQTPRRPSCFFRSARKTQTWLEDVKILLPVKLCWIPCSGFQRRSRKCLSQSDATAAILFFRSARKTQTWLRALRSCFLSRFVEFRSAVSEEKSKMYQPIRGKGGHLVFPIGPKNTNLIEGDEILLTVKFRWIVFSRFREEVENAKSLRQTDGRRTDGQTDGRTTDVALWQ